MRAIFLILSIAVAGIQLENTCKEGEQPNSDGCKGSSKLIADDRYLWHMTTRFMSPCPLGQQMDYIGKCRTVSENSPEMCGVE